MIDQFSERNRYFPRKNTIHHIYILLFTYSTLSILIRNCDPYQAIKMRYVYMMVYVVSILPNTEFGPNDHRKDAQIVRHKG